MGWNPDEHEPSGSGDHDDRDVPSGDYLVGLTWWDRISERAVKVRCEIIAGPMKGASCFPMVSVNVEEKKGSADRMFHICKSFNIKGNLEFDDACMNGHFMGRAGKVRIRREQKGRFTNHDIKKAFHRAETSQAEREKMVEWEEAFASRRQEGQSFRGNRGGGGQSSDPMGGGFGGDPGPSDDWNDDIPF